MADKPSPPTQLSQCRQDAANATPIDVGVLVTRCLGDLSFLRLIVKEFEVTGQVQVRKIVQHAQCGDAKAAAEAAHRLRGAASIIGAEGLSTITVQVEAHAGDVDGALLRLTHDLQTEMDRCLAYIPCLLADAERFPFRGQIK